MDPLCTSLIQQHLKSTNSSLVDQFKDKYQPLETKVHLCEVMSKWEEDQLARSLILNYLKTVSPAIAEEFKVKFQPQETNLQFEEVLSKWKEKLLTRSLVYNHLNTVAPSRAQEFQNKHGSSMENTPNRAYDPIMKMVIDSLSKENTMQNRNADQDYEKQLKPKNTKPKGMNTFTSEEVKRIERAVSMKEKAVEVAKEMGRKYMAVYHKMKSLERSAGMKSGKFSAEEVQRIRVAVMNKENHIAVAKELARPPESVRVKMYSIANDPGHGTRTNKSFSLQEDLLILDEVILHEDVTKLSCETTFSPSMAIREETGRNRSTLCARWDSHILPYLLQHYSGTTGFRIERILTRLVADKFTDQMGIDWSELVYQHKEFVGHTSASLSRTLQKIICDAKRYGRGSSLQEVADYAAEAYHPGKERKESSAKAARREEIVSYFKSKVAELGINVEL